MEKYVHKVHYYETDQMGITHHSNYIRWMEEARIDFLKKIGWDYARLEENGIFSPVINVECKYKQPTKFDENIAIDVSVEEFKGVKLVIGYKMTNSDGIIVCEARSSHCFLNPGGRPVKLNKEHPDFYNKLVELASNGSM